MLALPLRRLAPCQGLTASYAATLNLGSQEILHGTATLQYGPDAQHWRDDSLQQMSAPTDAGYRNRRSKSTANPQGALHRPAAEWQNTFSDTHQLPHWPTPIGAMLSQARCLSTARVLFPLLTQAHHVCTWEGPTVKVATTGRI